MDLERFCAEHEETFGHLCAITLPQLCMNAHQPNRLTCAAHSNLENTLIHSNSLGGWHAVQQALAEGNAPEVSAVAICVRGTALVAACWPPSIRVACRKPCVGGTALVAFCWLPTVEFACREPCLRWPVVVSCRWEHPENRSYDFNNKLTSSYLRLVYLKFETPPHCNPAVTYT